VQAVQVAPNKSGQCVVFQAQEYDKGAWRDGPTSPCFTLNSGSLRAAQPPLGPTAVGHLFRIHAS
jgi:hypothetical protein